jgi:CelD/BcsL family acetyltransferase involved in cellulose biosynthesis
MTTLDTQSFQARSFQAQVRRDDAALAELSGEWDELASRCRAATPFQAHAWLSSWWRRYGRPGQLRVVTVRHGGRLVAAAALYRRRRWYGSVLAPLGGALSDFADVLVDDACSGPAGQALAQALAGLRGWQVLDLPETRPGAAAASALRAGWRGRCWQVPASVCLELPAAAPEELIRELPGHARKTVRRRVNQIDRLAIDTRVVPAPEAAAAVAGMLRLHAQQWQGRAVNREHLRPAFAGHLAGAVPAMVVAGQAVLLEYRLAGVLVGANLVLLGRELAGGYLYGAHPGLRDQIDVSTLLITSALAEASRAGCATLSMLRGTEPYKQRWRPTEVVNARLLLARPGSPVAVGSLIASGYAGAVVLRAAALRLARRRAPWLRAVRDAARRFAARLAARLANRGAAPAPSTVDQP